MEQFADAVYKAALSKADAMRLPSMEFEEDSACLGREFACSTRPAETSLLPLVSAVEHIALGGR